MKKQFKGKAIYNPSGKAGEYSYWACNFYNGCSVGCKYCFNKKGMTSKVLGGDKPTLQKGLVDEYTACKIFIQEVSENVEELRKHGLFFSFTTDPLLPETKELTYFAIGVCQANRIPVKILTKMGQKEALEFSAVSSAYRWDNRLIAYGVTLTGCDSEEPNAPSNKSRVIALMDMKFEGYRTFASIEPIIDLDSSLSMVMKSVDFCDLFKVGLLSGKKYDYRELRGFILACAHLDNKLYFKDTFIKQAGLTREELPANCVTRDYNIFNRIATK
ncbi:hypothetical protein [Bacteroides sp. 51]|uniref:hypothetical protein n=1 Tax=Bacteroides sp. 51 TaxID=2302938 RepID=UPI0013D35399|nr:hypothetical protein [Bacteroides sp. 51]NDV81307.1 hypothetical protein [Bacteroides sp. 51]